MNTERANNRELTVVEVADRLRELTSGAFIYNVEEGKVVFDNGVSVSLAAVDENGKYDVSRDWFRPDNRESDHPDFIDDVIVRSYVDDDDYFGYNGYSITIDFMSEGMSVASGVCSVCAYNDDGINGSSINLCVSAMDALVEDAVILSD